MLKIGFAPIWQEEHKTTKVDGVFGDQRFDVPQGSVLVLSGLLFLIYINSLRSV